MTQQQLLNYIKLVTNPRNKPKDDWRLGQWMYIALESISPALVAELTNERHVDPYYDDTIIPKFWGWLMSQKFDE